MSDRLKLSRYQGCLLGGAVGDALGYPVEFYPVQKIVDQFGNRGISRLEEAGDPACISDDTQMSLAAANAILLAKSNPGYSLLHMLMKVYSEWYFTQSGPSFHEYVGDDPAAWIYRDTRLHARRAPGKTCLSSISSFLQDLKITQAQNNSKGCGTVMRAAPFGMMTNNSESRAAESAAVDAALTHGHVSAAACSAFQARLIYKMIHERPLRDYPLQDVILSVSTPDSNLQSLIDKAVKVALRTDLFNLEGLQMLGEGWVASEALAIAIYSAVRFQNDFHKAICLAVNHKGDSDSTGAICGNILGAWLGREAVESAFNLQYLELSDLIETVAADLFTAVETGVPEPGKDPAWDRKYRKAAAASV